ncbi:hypothetical protein [Vibrio chagasii]|uniref:hypothetical protein n=1 Tax=Vibrio chagasii TaxID=170679 RepID=UPI0037353057
MYAQHCHHKDKAIAMIYSSDDEHKGYFLVKSDVFEYHKTLRAMLFQNLSYLAPVRDVEFPETYLFHVRYGYNPVSSGK